MSGNEGKFSRYVTATITVRFQNRSRTYRTLWLFGSGMLAVDLVTGNIVQDFVNESVYPSLLTDTSLRSYPAVRDWLNSTQRFDASCKSGRQDVCCDAAMRCGVSSEDLRSTKPAPDTKAAPAPKEDGPSKKGWVSPPVTIISTQIAGNSIVQGRGDFVRVV
jgi:hypothetical protein